MLGDNECLFSVWKRRVHDVPATFGDFWKVGEISPVFTARSGERDVLTDHFSARVTRTDRERT